MPGTVRAKCESKVSIHPECGPLSSHVIAFKFVTFDVAIPVWIRETAREQFGSTLTSEQLEKSGADIWLSITEIRGSNLKEGPSRSGNRNIICAKGHNYEWLACGKIPDALVEGVYPWNGKKVHFEDPGHPILSVENSGQPWVWDWGKKMWLPDCFGSPAINVQDKNTGDKRKRDNSSQNRGLPKSHPQLSFSSITAVETVPIPPASELGP